MINLCTIQSIAPSTLLATFLYRVGGMGKRLLSKALTCLVTEVHPNPDSNQALTKCDDQQ